MVELINQRERNNMRGYFKGTIPETKNFRGQGELVMSVLGTDEQHAKSTVTIAREIADKLITRQDPERVVAFYVSVWGKKGFVKFVELSEPTEAVKAPDTVIAPPAEKLVSQEAKLKDLSGFKLSEAVTAVLEYKARSLSIDEITKTLNENGYDFKPNQVQSATHNLIRKGVLAKIGEGKFAISSE